MAHPHASGRRVPAPAIALWLVAVAWPAVGRSLPAARGGGVRPAVANVRAHIVASRPVPSTNILQPTPCLARRGIGHVVTQLAACPRGILDGVRAWNPDVLVAIGGGILPTGEPGCATMQRAHATLELWQELGGRPSIVLSGRGPMYRTSPLDDAARACLTARDSQTRRHAGVRIALPALSADGFRMTEADHMCARMLRAVPADGRAAILARIVFEPRATSTSENAIRSTPILRDLHAARAIIVTTHAFRDREGMETHGLRAIADFRSAQSHGPPIAIGGVTCPYANGGPAWTSLPPRRGPTS